MSVEAVEAAVTTSAAPAAKRAPDALSWPRLIAYAMPNLAIGMLIMPVATIVPSLYVKERGVALATMGTILMVARIFDAVIDQVIGYLSDATRRLIPGGRKAWLAAGGLIAMPAIFFLCAPPPTAGAVYFVIGSLAAYLAWGMLLIPYTAWGAELSRDYNERTRIVTARESVSQSGSLMFLVTPLILAAYGLAADTQMNLHATRYVALVLLILIPATILPALIFVPQGVQQSASAPVDLKSAFRSLARNKPMQIFAGAFLIGEIGYGMFVTAIFFYLDAYLGLGTRFSHVVILCTLATLLSLPLWERASRLIDKRNCVILSWTVQALALLALITVPRGGTGFVQLMIILGISSAFIGSAAVVTPSILGDIVDYDTWKTGGYRAGAYFALYSLSLKIVVAVGGGIALWLLGNFGYNVIKPETNGHDANMAMLVVFAVVPAALRFLGLTLLWRYPLDARRQRIVRRRLEQREARSQAAAARTAAISPGVSA